MDRAKMHDVACEIADAETVDLLDAKHDAYARWCSAGAAFDEARRAAYDRAYLLLEAENDK